MANWDMSIVYNMNFLDTNSHKFVSVHVSIRVDSCRSLTFNGLNVKLAYYNKLKFSLQGKKLNNTRNESWRFYVAR